jgi:ATP-dependent DNA helicase RecG
MIISCLVASVFLGKPQITPGDGITNAREIGSKAMPRAHLPKHRKLKAKGLTGRAIGKLTMQLFSKIRERDLPENLPDELLKN